MKKRLCAIVLAIVLSFSVTGCDNRSTLDIQKDKSVLSFMESAMSGGVKAGYDIEFNNYVDPYSEDSSGSSDGMAEVSTEQLEKEQKEFDDWLYDEFVDSVTSDTLTLHYSVADPEQMGIKRPKPSFGDTKSIEESMEEAKKEYEEEIAKLNSFDYKLLTPQQKYDYDLIKDLLDNNQMEFEVDPYLQEPFSNVNGIQKNLPIVLAEYQFYCEQDVKDYLDLIETMPGYVDYALEIESAKISKGVFMSSASAKEVSRQCKEFVANPDKNLLITNFEEKIKNVNGLSDKKIKKYIKKNNKLVKSVVIPSFNKIDAFFVQNQKMGTNETGLVGFEGGKDYYNYLLKANVGTSKSAEEIIAMIEGRINKDMSRMYELARSNGTEYQQFIEDYNNGTIFEEQETKDIVRYFEQACKDKFPEIPKIDFQIAPVDKSLEEISSPAFYMIPPIDKYDSNYIYINNKQTNNNDLWSTLAHEGIPGHMYQSVYFLASNPRPLRKLLNYTAYSEGWATYCEMMSFDYYDKYPSEVYGELLKINREISILVCTRIEIGVNYEGWDLDETKKYMKNSGYGEDSAEEMYNYVLTEPVNYQLYCVGYLEIEEMKEKAKNILGDKFDEIGFNQAVLDAGPSNFDMVEKKVDGYIKKNR